MAVVCILCGFWHGANWTFLIWGIYHALFLILERVTGARSISPGKFEVLRRMITLFIITVGWVIFRSADLSQAMGFLERMFTFSDLTLSYELLRVLNYRNIIFMTMGLPVIFLSGEFSGIKLLTENENPIALIAGALMIFLLLPLCAAMIVGGTSSPFIYYEF
jgi:alginate O-acetyltransferase complex protein AlgI